MEHVKIGVWEEMSWWEHSNGSMLTGALGLCLNIVAGWTWFWNVFENFHDLTILNILFKWFRLKWVNSLERMITTLRPLVLETQLLISLLKKTGWVAIFNCWTIIVWNYFASQEIIFLVGSCYALILQIHLQNWESWRRHISSFNECYYASIEGTFWNEQLVHHQCCRCFEYGWVGYGKESMQG